MKKAKRSNFGAALTQAEKELAKAQRDRSQAQATLVYLNSQIPTLEQTIRALKNLLPNGAKLSKPDPLAGKNAVVKELAKGIPPEIAQTLDPRAYAPPEDLTGMGSIPAGAPKAPTKVLTEDDLLPPIPGEPILE